MYTVLCPTIRYHGAVRGLRSVSLSYRLVIPIISGPLLALLDLFSQEANINTLRILRHGAQSPMKASILKDAASEKVRWRDHPDIPRVERVRELGQNAREVLAGTASDAYSFESYGLRRLVVLRQPLCDLMP